jgi:hypothetical protein
MWMPYLELPDIRTYLAREEEFLFLLSVIDHIMDDELLLLDVMGMSYFVCSLSADLRPS